MCEFVEEYGSHELIFSKQEADKKPYGRVHDFHPHDNRWVNNEYTRLYGEDRKRDKTRWFEKTVFEENRKSEENRKIEENRKFESKI